MQIEIAGEAAIDDQRHRDPPRVDQRLDPPLAVQLGDLAKRRRTDEMRDEVARSGAVVAIVYGDRDVIDVETRRIAENNQLDQRRADHHEPALRVFEDRQQLFDNQSENLPPHRLIQALACKQSRRTEEYG